MATTITIEGSQSGLPSGVRHIGPITLTFSGAVVGSALTFPSATTATATPPSGTTGMLLVPPTTTTATLTLKGDAADVGVLMTAGVPVLVPIGGAGAVYVTSSAAITGRVELIWL